MPSFNGTLINIKGRSEALIVRRGSGLINTTQNAEIHSALFAVGQRRSAVAMIVNKALTVSLASYRPSYQHNGKLAT